MLFISQNLISVYSQRHFITVAPSWVMQANSVFHKCTCIYPCESCFWVGDQCWKKREDHDHWFVIDHLFSCIDSSQIL